MCSKPQLYHHSTVSTLKTFCKPQKHLKSMFTTKSKNNVQMKRFLGYAEKKITLESKLLLCSFQ